MKLITMTIASLALSSCAFASFVEPNPSNNWKPYTELQAGFTALGDNASIGSVVGVSVGAENKTLQLGVSYNRADSDIKGVGLTLHSVTADFYRVLRLGVVKARFGGGFGVGIPNYNGPTTADKGLLTYFGAGVAYDILPNLSLGLNTRVRLFRTTTHTIRKVTESDTLFIGGVPVDTVETETLVTDENSQNLNALETLINLTWRF